QQPLQDGGIEQPGDQLAGQTGQGMVGQGGNQHAQADQDGTVVTGGQHHGQQLGLVADFTQSDHTGGNEEGIHEEERPGLTRLRPRRPHAAGNAVSGLARPRYVRIPVGRRRHGRMAKCVDACTARDALSLGRRGTRVGYSPMTGGANYTGDFPARGRAAAIPALRARMRRAMRAALSYDGLLHVFPLPSISIMPSGTRIVEFDRPDMAVGTHTVAEAWARVNPPLSPQEREFQKDRIRRLLKSRNAVLVAHYYVDADIQDLAEETGGCVSDSLEMARFGRDHAADTLVVSGVRFMGETAKILSP